MRNPLKMNPIEKRMLIGGLANSLTYWSNFAAMNMIPEYPAELKNRVDPHLPRNGEIIGSVAPPATFWIAKQVVKSTETKEKLADMTFGATLYGIPNLVHNTLVQTVYQAGIDARPATGLTAPRSVTKYTTTATQTRIATAGTTSKYAITA